MKITEITDSNEAGRGPLYNSPQNQIYRKMGAVNHRMLTATEGTFRQISTDKWFDWWKNENETVTIIDSE